MNPHNHSTHTGYLTRDAEEKGNNVVKFSLATRRTRVREGEPDADFPEFVMFGETAVTFAKRFLKKGAYVTVHSEYQQGSYEKDGQQIRTHQFVTDTFSIGLGPKQEEGEGARQVSDRPQAQSNGRPQPRGQQPNRSAGADQTYRANTGANVAVDDEDVPF